MTSVVAGNCTYIPNQPPRLCLVTPGTEVIINGSYFCPSSSYNGAKICDCDAAIVSSWNPNWPMSASGYNNPIVGTVPQAVAVPWPQLFTIRFGVTTFHIPQAKARGVSKRDLRSSGILCAAD